MKDYQQWCKKVKKDVILAIKSAEKEIAEIHRQQRNESDGFVALLPARKRVNSLLDKISEAIGEVRLEIYAGSESTGKIHKDWLDTLESYRIQLKNILDEYPY